MPLVSSGVDDLSIAAVNQTSVEDAAKVASLKEQGWVVLLASDITVSMHYSTTVEIVRR